MLVTKLVIRILDAQDNLLGWAEAEGVAYGDGKLTVAHPVLLGIEQRGRPAMLSVHWADVNVEIRSAMDRADVKAGDVFQIPAPWAAITVGPMATGLPPVTVSSPVRIVVPVGGLGATPH